MKKALQNLKDDVCKMSFPNAISDEEWLSFTKNTTIALMAGGESSRFQSVPGASKTNKNSYRLPNNDSMIEMAIRMYRDAGFKDFAALVYHKAESIIELLGDGSRLGVNIKYSHDPEKQIGKGSAVLNALLNSSIPEDKNLIVHNPDDVIINFPGSFPRHITSGHLNGIKKGMLATVVVAEENPYDFTGMKIKDNIIEQIEMYPMIPIPTHIGVTIFSPESYEYFHRSFDLTKKSDFEKILFPILAEKKKLYAVSVPSECWVAVNNLKAFRKLAKYLLEQQV